MRVAWSIAIPLSLILALCSGALATPTVSTAIETAARDSRSIATPAVSAIEAAARGLEDIAGRASPATPGDRQESRRASTQTEPSCLVQDGTEIGTITPLTTDQDVVTFYSYGVPAPASYNGSYPTQSGDSMIFIHRNSATGALSLVVVHDQPNDGSGGSVHMDVSGLGTAASVVVEDDPGENLAAGLDGLGNASLDWQWLPCCTDGVAIAGIDWNGGCISVDPQFTQGIVTWSFVDGSTLERVGLDPTAPLQICPGGCNACPTAVAIAPETAECSGSGQATVTLDGSSSSDPDGDPLSYEWNIDGGAGTASGEMADVTLELGLHDAALTVSDGVCDDADTTSVEIEDTTAPTVDACPADASVTLDPDACEAGLMQTAEGSDVCEGPLSDSHLFAFTAPGAQTHGYELTDSSGNQAFCQQTVTALDESAPTITCPADETLVLDAAACTASLDALATGADACDGPLSESHHFEFFAPGSEPHTYVLADASGNSSSCDQTVVAVDLTPPLLACPPDQTVVLSPDTCEASLVAEAAGVDACDGPLSESHLFAFTAPGLQTWSYEVADSSGNVATCTQTVTAVDLAPPVYTPGPTIELWAPNHKYMTVTLGQCGTAYDACSGPLDLDGGDAMVVAVISDEPDEGGAGGDGNTTEDATIVDGHTVALRGERQGGDDGRAYSITMGIHDGAANALTAGCTVVVEHDQGQNP